ncbi:hypothetical protein N7478_004601 [Penicillium angulare]|uniref:uncharacterized protein n=1 Tax=Penicillium angulare TaxID=116970 RepID=UPI002540B510|nr:uncharacterized protein N7478_004601 [Penicillium angulare]KAJ5279229.1 hypothetical protein N7478_004601 [Penicillium angulare]
MVLEGASPQAGSFSNESPSTGAPIRQATNHPQSLLGGLRIKPEFIEHPDLFTLYFGFLGNRSWQKSVGRNIYDRLQGTWVLTGRTATQEELDSFCANSTHALYYGRIGLPVSLIAGGVWEYRKAARQTADLTFAQRLTTMLSIARADPSAFWPQAARTGFRVFWIGSCGWMLSTVGSTWTGMTDLLRDPKLAQWRHDTKGQKEEEVRKRKLEAAASMSMNVNGKREVVERLRRDLSGDSGFDETQTPEPEQYSYDAPAANQSTYDSPASGYQSQSSRYGSAPAQRSSSQGESSTDFFLGGQDDDASPTAAEYRNTNPNGSSMSTWDRIRAQNAPPRSQAPARQSSTSGWGQAQAQSPPADDVPVGARDSYDVDRRLEKDQAQADFDRMMEQERNASGEPTRRGWGS